jgi:hypothetical protein
VSSAAGSTVEVVPTGAQMKNNPFWRKITNPDFLAFFTLFPALDQIIYNSSITIGYKL